MARVSLSQLVSRPLAASDLRAIQGKVPFITLLSSQMHASGSPIHPFLSSALPVPPKSECDGPLFELRHDYPATLPPGGDLPWLWVFSTLVYDKNAPGKDAWDKMVPLGATWGGDPAVVNTDSAALTPPVAVSPKLAQNWINLKTPDYARATLGWDGRLSGPNDGAVVTPAWAGGN